MRSWGVGPMASGVNLIVSAGGTLFGKFGGSFAGKNYEHYIETKVDNFVNDMNN